MQGCFCFLRYKVGEFVLELAYQGRLLGGRNISCSLKAPWELLTRKGKQAQVRWLQAGLTAYTKCTLLVSLLFSSCSLSTYHTYTNTFPICTLPYFPLGKLLIIIQDCFNAPFVGKLSLCSHHASLAGLGTGLLVSRRSHSCLPKLWNHRSEIPDENLAVAPALPFSPSLSL